MALKNKNNMCTLLNFFNFLKNKEKFKSYTSSSARKNPLLIFWNIFPQAFGYKFYIVEII